MQGTRDGGDQFDRFHGFRHVPVVAGVKRFVALPQTGIGGDGDGRSRASV